MYPSPSLSLSLSLFSPTAMMHVLQNGPRTPVACVRKHKHKVYICANTLHT